MLIIGRGVATPIEGKITCFDYVGCTYPEGLIGETVLYINHADIEELVFSGYQDEDDERMQKNLKEHITQLFPDAQKV